MRQIHRLIGFANMKLESVDAVRLLFSFDLAQFQKTGQRARVPLGRSKASLHDLRFLQRDVRERLAQITAGTQVTDEINAAIDRWLREAHKTDARATGGGRITVRLELDSPRAQCMYAMLLLRDTEGLAKRVGPCLWCGRYFFDNRTRTGPRNKFCPNTHHRNSFYQYPHNNDGRKRRQPELP